MILPDWTGAGYAFGMKFIAHAAILRGIMIAVAIFGLSNRPLAADLADPSTGESHVDEELRCEILHMKDLDQEARLAAIKPGVDVEALVKISQEIDVPHTNRMKSIIAQHGWPGKSLVGQDGAFAAWLLVQHATHDVKFMEDCLVLMTAAAEKGEASRKDLALLIDRVRVRQHKPQLYGTQYKAEPDGGWVPEPIEDEEHIETRRKSMGLSTLAEELRIIRQVYARPNPPPK
jgi:hypothetical protein